MLDKSFDAVTAEPLLYDAWERGGAFAARPGGNAVPFTVIAPPANVTGSLHVGHALTFTVQDILVRWRRMQGRDVLYQPGTDHAGIATQMVVERLLDAEGTSRAALGREAFVERVWRQKEQSGGAIAGQLRRLGASPDWARDLFTLDPRPSAAVTEVFVTLHEQGLVYRDRRLVNWDPQLGTAISDLEVEGREVRGQMWHLRYPLADDPDRFVVVATTRPETMLGDTAVAVHPDDARYADLVGCEVVLPLTGRRVPIVADTYSDPEKGTGAVKITPAHDFNDFAVGQRHGLAMPSVIDRAGRVTLSEIGGAAADPFLRALDGQDRYAARAAIVAELDRRGALERVEPHIHQVPHGDRSGVAIEPLLTVQWYCDAKALAGPAIAAVEEGRTRFEPRQWENTFFAWMREIEPWCISRQLWWGHRIPAWYGPDGHFFVARDEAAARAAARVHYGHETELTRDPDVLDTWFSSALWPFSTLGWPERTPALARYYPTDVLVTGFDIIFFWVARMMMMGVHFMGEVPFRTVYIHGLVRDERGQKMSKTRGNVLDPLDLIDRYGTDALRFTIASLTGPGRDVKLGAARVESYRGFVTKLWNAARFCEINGMVPGAAAAFDPVAVRLDLSRWLLVELGEVVGQATRALEEFRVDEYAASCYDFVWNRFCDWFLELAKPGLEGGDAAELRAVGAHVFGTILRLLHPAMPFVTEALHDRMGFGEPASLIQAGWPDGQRYATVPGATDGHAEIVRLIRLIGTVRTVRSEIGVPPSVLAPVLVKDASEQTLARGRRWFEALRRLARASEFAALVGDVPKGAAQALVDEALVVLPLAGIIDLDAERARLGRDRDRAAREVDTVARKLENADFVARAKPEVVEETRGRLETARAELARLEAALGRLVT